MNIFNRFAQLIRHDNRISLLARLIYCDLAEICTKEGGCIISNDYLAKVFNVEDIDIVLALAELENMLMISFERLNNTVSVKEPVIIKNKHKKERIVKACRIIHLNKNTNEVFGIDKKDLFEMWA